MLEVYIATSIALIAVWFDCKERRIPNPLVSQARQLDLFLGAVSGGIQGFAKSCLGMIAGIGILFIPFALGWIGAGDAKFLGVIGAFFGVKGAAFSMLYGPIAGGLISAVVLLRHGQLGGFLMRCLGWLAGVIGRILTGTLGLAIRNFGRADSLATMRTSGFKIPYSVAISVGMVIAIITDFSPMAF